MTRAAVYIRQSRHKTYERTESPAVQEQACRALPAVAGASEITVYADLDVSGGKTVGRHGWAGLLAAIEAGKLDVVAVYDQSRTFRNTRDALDFYARMEKLPEVEVVFVHGRFDRTAVGGFSYTVLSAAHEMERRMSGDKIRASYARANSLGHATGPVAFGFERIGSRADGKVVLHEANAAAVRRLFELYAEGGYSVKTLAEKFNLEGIPGPGTSGRWLPDTVADVLQNVATIGKTYSVSRRRREGEIIAAQWPAIVDPVLFERVKARLNRNRRLGFQNRKNREYAFRSLLHCVVCDAPMRASMSHDVAIYRCRRDVVNPCGTYAVREDALLPWADQLFDALAPLRLRSLGRRLDVPPAKAALSSVAAIESRLDRLRELYVDGQYPRDKFDRELARLEALRDEYAAQAALAANPVELTGLHERWKAGGASERRALLMEFFQSLKVEGGQIVAMVPRPDRISKVELLVEYAFGAEADGTRTADLGIDEQPAGPRVGGSGEGGI